MRSTTVAKTTALKIFQNTTLSLSVRYNALQTVCVSGDVHLAEASVLSFLRELEVLGDQPAYLSRALKLLTRVTKEFCKYRATQKLRKTERQMLKQLKKDADAK